MDVTAYYITTISNALVKIGPAVGFIVIGYLIFIKLPFWFFMRNMNVTKKEFDNKLPKIDDKDYSVDNYKDFQRRMKLMAPSKEKEKTQDKDKEKEYKQKSQQKTRPTNKAPVGLSPEEIFEFKAGESFTSEELRKKYHALIKKNHPDKVAELGPDFKKLAEKNTKEINEAYSKLKSKARSKAA